MKGKEQRHNGKTTSAAQLTNLDKERWDLLLSTISLYYYYSSLLNPLPPPPPPTAPLVSLCIPSLSEIALH